MHVTRWVFAVGLLLVACAHRPIDPPRAAAAVAAPATARASGESAITVFRLDRAEASPTVATVSVVVRSGEAVRSVALDVGDAGGAVMTATSADAQGVVVRADRVVEHGVRRRFVAETGPGCASPWLVAVEAELLVASASATADADDLRIGCGPIQHVDFVTHAGRARAIVYGDAGFDVRMVAGEMNVVRSELERIFEVRVDARWLDEIHVHADGRLLVPRAEPSGTGLRVHMPAQAPWNAEARLAVAATVARVHLTRLLAHVARTGDRPAGPDRVTDRDGASDPDTADPGDPLASHPAALRAAVLHGVALGIARESLFELGLLSPDEYAADLDRAEVMVAERGAAWRAPDVVDARDVGARAAAVSIEASILAWSLRIAGVSASLPAALVRATSGSAEGASVSRAWAAAIGGPARPETRSLGPCIVPRKGSAAVVELGYAAGWDPERSQPQVVALQPGGAAERAGLQIGDEIHHSGEMRAGALLSVRRTSGETPATTSDVTVLIETPAPAPAVPRRRWVRKGDIADDRCYPSG